VDIQLCPNLPSRAALQQHPASSLIDPAGLNPPMGHMPDSHDVIVSGALNCMCTRVYRYLRLARCMWVSSRTPPHRKPAGGQKKQEHNPHSIGAAVVRQHARCRCLNGSQR